MTKPKKPKIMTAREFSVACDRLRLPKGEIASRLGIHRATLHSYETGKLKVTPLVTLAMQALRREVDGDERWAAAAGTQPATAAD